MFMILSNIDNLIVETLQFANKLQRLMLIRSYLDFYEIHYIFYIFQRTEELNLCMYVCVYVKRREDGACARTCVWISYSYPVHCIITFKGSNALYT